MGQLNQSLRPRERPPKEEVEDKIAVSKEDLFAEVEGPWEEIVCKTEVGES